MWCVLLAYCAGVAVASLMVESDERDFDSAERVGASVAQVTRHPYAASLMHNATYVCSATILNEYWLLTSAKCIDSEATSYSVRVGSSYNNQGGSVIQVQSAKKNEDKSVAAVKLHAPLVFGSSVHAAWLPDGREVALGYLVSVLAWTPSGVSQSAASVQSAKRNEDESVAAVKLRAPLVFGSSVHAAWLSDGREVALGYLVSVLAWTPSGVSQSAASVQSAKRNEDESVAAVKLRAPLVFGSSVHAAWLPDGREVALGYLVSVLAWTPSGVSQSAASVQSAKRNEDESVAAVKLRAPLVFGSSVHAAWLPDGREVALGYLVSVLAWTPSGVSRSAASVQSAKRNEDESVAAVKLRAPLVFGSNVHAAWLPDGREVALGYLVSVLAWTPSGVRQSAASVQSAKRNEDESVAAVKLRAPLVFGSNVHAAWLPDGREVALGYLVSVLAWTPSGVSRSAASVQSAKRNEDASVAAVKLRAPLVFGSSVHAALLPDGREVALGYLVSVLAWTPSGVSRSAASVQSAKRNEDESVAAVKLRAPLVFGSSVHAAWLPDGREVALGYLVSVLAWTPSGVSRSAASVQSAKRNEDESVAAVKLRAPLVFGSSVHAAWLPDGREVALGYLVSVLAWTPSGVSRSAASVQSAKRNEDESVAAVKLRAPLVFGSSVHAAWLPDGREVALGYLVSVLAWTPSGVSQSAASVQSVKRNEDKSVAAVKLRAPLVFGSSVHAAWLPDGREVALGYLVSVLAWTPSGVSRSAASVQSVKRNEDKSVAAVKLHAPLVFGSSVLAAWLPDGREVALGYLVSVLAWTPSGVSRSAASVQSVKRNEDESVAAVKLRAPLVFGSSVHAAWLPDGREVALGYLVSVLAWTPSGHLRAVNAPSMEPRICEAYSQQRNYVCVGGVQDPDRHFCRRDNGGAVLQNNTLIAVSAFIFPCANYGKVHPFPKVPVAWLNSVIWDDKKSAVPTIESMTVFSTTIIAGNVTNATTVTQAATPTTPATGSTTKYLLKIPFYPVKVPLEPSADNSVKAKLSMYESYLEEKRKSNLPPSPRNVTDVTVGDVVPAEGGQKWLKIYSEQFNTYKKFKDSGMLGPRKKETFDYEYDYNL